MANLEELLAALPEADLREALQTEIARLKRRTRFGLVYLYLDVNDTDIRAKARGVLNNQHLMQLVEAEGVVGT